LAVHTGHAKGNLSLDYSDILDPEIILVSHPEIKEILEEIMIKGWRYLYIETKGKAISEFDVDHRYRFTVDGLGFNIEINLGQTQLPVTRVTDVEEFRINICSKAFPRAITIDLSKGIVTYIHEAFWGLQEDWKNQRDRVAKGKEVYEIAKWLLETKNMKLHENYRMERFRELSKLFETIAVD
jgi:hypothetical protein